MRKLSKSAWVLIGILILGAFFRFYSINEIPPGLYPDEAMNGNNALEAIHNTDFSAKGGPALGWKIFYPENNGREGFFINIQALSVWLFGNEPWALRVVSAIFGTFTILGVYLVAKELLNSEMIALLSSFFLATSYWHINFSRIGFRAITIPFFSAFGIYWLLKGLRTGKISSVALAGIFIGLGFHTYIAFRFMPFVLAVPILWYIIRWLKERRANLQPTNYPASAEASAGRQLQANSCIPCAIILFLFVTFVVALPIGWYFLQNPADFFGRGGQVSVFAAERPLYEFVKSNLLTLQMFFWQGDCNPRHNFNCQPQLHPIVALFFLLGILIAIRDIFRKPRANTMQLTTLFAWFLFMSFPATLTAEGLPHALRAIGMIPPVMIFSGLGASWLWQTVKKYLENMAKNSAYMARANQLSRIKKEVAFLALLLLFFAALQTGKTYFFRFPSSPETYSAFAADFHHIGQYLNALPYETPKYVLVNLSGTEVRGIPMPAQTVMFITDTFRNESRITKHITYLTPESLASTALPADAIIVPLNANRETLRLLKEQFPGIRFSALGDFITGRLSN
ncbi:MAG: glycosyltransferase family 39 protein [bacterium]|nr:glycosyltransferase family 39 protein [bacterium]